MLYGILMNPTCRLPVRHCSGISRSVLHDAYLGGSQHPILDRITDLLAIQNRSRLFARHGNLVHSLVTVGIKFFSRGVEWFDMVLEQSLEQLPVRYFYPGVELL